MIDFYDGYGQTLPRLSFQATGANGIGLRVPIIRLGASGKTSQNRGAEDRAGIVMALADSEGPSYRAAAALISGSALHRPLQHRSYRNQ